MACSYGRAVLLTCRRAICTNAVKRKEFVDPMELATGLRKRELIALASGNDDPFNLKPIKRGPGTKDSPNLIPSAFESRLVGCVCEEDQLHVNWMWLHQGSPRRCGCGYWFKLVYKAPV